MLRRSLARGKARIVVAGTPAALIAARATRTGEHLAAYVAR